MRYRPEPRVATKSNPARSWVWSQHWLDVLFLHWRVPAHVLRPHLPASLEVATYAGQAWVSVVAFRLRVRPRWLPFLPCVSHLAEVNVRTYVRHGGQPGIWFLSVHANNALAIRLATWLTPMPYVGAPIRYQRRSGEFSLQARQPNSRGLLLDLLLRPDSQNPTSSEEPLDVWLLEQYRLFVARPQGGLLHAEVAHPRWRTQAATAIIVANNLGHPLGLDLRTAPDRVHFSPGVRARFGAFCGVHESPQFAASRTGT